MSTIKHLYLEVYKTIYSVPAKNVNALINNAIKTGCFDLTQVAKKTKYQTVEGSVKVGKRYHTVYKCLDWDSQDWQDLKDHLNY